MDPNEIRKLEEQRPFCKVCGETDGLLEVPVCDCTGSVANICLDCLRGTIIHTCLLEKSHLDPETGYPLCPDCHAPYRNIDFDRLHEDEPFLDYILRAHNLSRRGTMAMFGIPSLMFMGVAAGYFGLLSQITEDRTRRTLTLIFMCVSGIIGLVLMYRAARFYDLFQTYRGRRPSQLLINPAKTQDVIIEMEKIIHPFLASIEAPEPTTPPLPRPPSPQILPIPRPPIEQPIPPERPQFIRPVQFRPNELSRRGRRWSATQLPRQHQPSARQNRSHTPRRSLQQQPRSRHQRRQQ